MAMDMLRVPRFTPDTFQKKVLENMHFEFFLSKCRVVITPNLQVVTTGDAEHEELEDVRRALEGNEELLEKARWYILYNLTLYSSILETNSYYITSNDYLLLVRFVAFPDFPDSFIIKLYTLPGSDILAGYQDKIYLGRDLVSLKSLRRNIFGLKETRNTLIHQFLRLKERLAEHLPVEVFDTMTTDYLEAMGNTLSDLAEAGNEMMEKYPSDISTESVELESLNELSNDFRSLKHIMIDLEISLRDVETQLFDYGHSRPVRYVTKFRKDVTNFKNFIMARINSRIMDAVNDIHL